MSGKLDQSLDQILGDQKKTGGRRGRPGRRVANAARVTKATPSAGVQKNRATKAAPAVAPATKGATAGTETKIIVSNLPSDVNEAQIKEYFGQSVAPVSRATLAYGPNGNSRGIATIMFKKPGSANEAVKKLNGMLVDKKPMRIEVVLDARSAQRTDKALSERVNQPKTAAPKANTTEKKEAARGGKAGRGRGGRARGGRPRAKPKTAEELDAEMADYFDPNAAASNTENVPATNGAGADDIGMDEIS